MSKFYLWRTIPCIFIISLILCFSCDFFPMANDGKIFIFPSEVWSFPKMDSGRMELKKLAVLDYSFHFPCHVPDLLFKTKNTIIPNPILRHILLMYFTYFFRLNGQRKMISLYLQSPYVEKSSSVTFLRTNVWTETLSLTTPSALLRLHWQILLSQVQTKCSKFKQYCSQKGTHQNGYGNLINLQGSLLRKISPQA